MTSDEETVSYLYHFGLDWLAKTSIQQKDIIEQLQARLKTEAARSQNEDSLALRILANSLEPFLQD